MHVLNEDTIWGVGSVGIVNSVARGLIYLSTDGGNTWGYQVPDTSINVFQYHHIQFTDKQIGWAYGVGGGESKGIHTVSGGSDTTIILDIKQLNSMIPEEYVLYQNYPNPFNPTTNINFTVQSSNNIKLSIYDITGKEVALLVNEKLQAGEYEYSFNGSGLSSGVYFYSLFIEGVVISTRKMLLVK